MLEGKIDIDEGGNSLDGTAVLGVFDEVSLTTLVFGIPFENVELGVIGMLRRRDLVHRVGKVGERLRGLVMWLFRVLGAVRARCPTVGILTIVHL